MMEPRIVDLEPRKLIGMNQEMSLAEDQTPRLWSTVMLRRNEVQNRVGNYYVSMQVYRTGVNRFEPHEKFVKWAVVEVSEDDVVPVGMTSYRLNGGQYAVFLHTGPASSFPVIMERIFVRWLPTSGYELDDREHFERLPEGYVPTDPEAKEEFWIPVRSAN